MNRAAKLAAGTISLGLLAYWRIGTVPDSAPDKDRACGHVAVKLECSDLKQLRSGFPCESGPTVAWFEVVADRTLLNDPPAIAEQFRRRAAVMPGSLKRIDCADAKRPGKTLTPLGWSDVPAGQKCISGIVSKDTSESADGSRWRTWKEPHECCDPNRCRCDDPPCVITSGNQIAGAADWRQRLKEQRPDLVPGDER